MSPLLPRLTRAVATVLALAVFRSDTFAQSPPPSDWDDYVAGFLDSYFHNNPTFAVSAGRHEFDGRLPDWSENGLEAWKAKLHLVRRIAASFNLDAADSTRRFERDYLVAQIDRDLFWLERADWPHRNPEFYAGGLDPNVYVTHEYAPPAQRMRAFTRYATNLPVALAQMRANLHTPMPKAYAQIAQGRFGGLADYLKTDVPTVFASVSDSGLRREFDKANAGAIKALQETAAWFAAEEKRGTDAYALGPKLFSEMLKMTEGVDVPLDTLEAWGRRDLERNLAALREACGQFVPGKDPAACMSAMEAHKSSLPPVEEARRQLEEMMWEAGLGAGNPEIHLGQIANALLRDVRYLSAIGLHTGGMTIAESEQLFKEKAFKDSGGAEQQALRGAYDPGSLNYTLGKLMIRRLRDDWTSTRGGRKAWREFHDQFLSFGGPPIPLVRKAMLGTSRGVL